MPTQLYASRRMHLGICGVHRRGLQPLFSLKQPQSVTVLFLALQLTYKYVDGMCQELFRSLNARLQSHQKLLMLSLRHCRNNLRAHLGARRTQFWDRLLNLRKQWAMAPINQILRANAVFSSYRDLKPHAWIYRMMLVVRWKKQPCCFAAGNSSYTA